MGYEKSEKMPKGVTASDMTGQKRVGASSVDKEKFHSGASGEKMPKGALASDMSGERRAKIVGGVGMGSKDSAMRNDTGKQDGFCGEMKGGSREHMAYVHERKEYR
jgi:hypothetical protein